MEKLVSVIIPTFNREKFLKRSIESVLGQIYKNIEIIIVDDFSTDNTASLVGQFCVDYGNIKYISNDRKKGASGARNTGILSSSGDYVCFLDSDDEYRKDHVSSRIEFITKYNLDIVFGDYEIYDSEGNSTLGSFFEKKAYLKNILCQPISGGFIVKERVCLPLVLENFFSLGTVMVKSEIVKHNLIREDLNYAEDRDFGIRVGSISNIRFGCLENATYIAYRHGGNSTFDNYENDMKKWNNLITLFTGYLRADIFNRDEKEIIKKQIKGIYRTIVVCERKYKNYKKAFKNLILGVRYGVDVVDSIELVKCFALPFLKS